MKREVFSTYNPAINFAFYIVAILFGMFFVHPSFLLCSVFCSSLYYITLKGAKAIRFFLMILPILIVVSLANPLFNTYGDTVLFTYLSGRPYTLEALFYGMALSGIFITVIMWFASYNVIMTSDRFLYIFGKGAPSLSLMLTMILRLIPNFQKKAVQIAAARKSLGKGMGKDEASEGRRGQIQNGMTVVSSLTTWVLEGGIVTADSMRSRGYGSGKRTCFSIYRFEYRDGLLLGAIVVLGIIVAFCGIRGGMEAAYTPHMEIEEMSNPYSAAGIIAYFILLIIPAALNIREEITWRILRSRI